MTLFRKKPVIVEATRWLQNGDHPADDCFRVFEDTGIMPQEPREGLIVRYFRHPSLEGELLCGHCSNRLPSSRMD